LTPSLLFRRFDIGVIDGKIAFFGKAQPGQLEQSKQIIDAECV
jgi:hypothetical protein